MIAVMIGIVIKNKYKTNYYKKTSLKLLDGIFYIILKKH